MLFRHTFVPIALFQLLPCQGDDVFSGFSGGGDFPPGNDMLAVDDMMIVDDTFSVISEEYFDLAQNVLSDSGVQECLDEIDLFGLMDDPFATVTDYCDPTDEKKFNAALDAFETCSHFDMKELIETFASAVLGLGLNCASYATELITTYEMAQFGGDINVLPRVPNNCVDALVGDNPFGNMMLASNEYPKRELTCFADLAEALPLCTLKEWPVPIVGRWLKSISCVVGRMDTQSAMDYIALSELEQLSGCLPTVISEENCQSVLDSCRQDTALISIYMPAPFNAMPLPESFQDAVQNAGADKPRFESTMKRYEDFRQSCTLADDRAIWERVPGKSTSTSMSDLIGIQKAGSGGASSKFLPGFVTGALLACVGFFIFLKKRGGNSSKPYNNIELNSLELSTENRFT